MEEANTLGIDIGGSRLRAAVVSARGEVLSRAEATTPARSSGEAVVAAVAEVANRALQSHRSSVVAVGVCAPGPLDSVQGIALATPTIDGFRDFPLRDRIAASIGLPTFLDHDGHAAAYGEWRHGAGQGATNLVYVTVSTGIGGGAIVDGNLQRGRRGMAAHVGHVIIDPDGPVCNCGAQGCWEALAAGPAFNAAARLGGFADGAAIFAAARLEQPDAVALLRAEARWLAIGLVNLIHIYSPDIVVLGGGVMAGLDLMRPHIAAEIAARAMRPFRDTPLVRTALQDNAGLIGAAALGQRQFTKSCEQ
ncbi:MAG: ROK family protein [bacterium]